MSLPAPHPGASGAHLHSAVVWELAVDFGTRTTTAASAREGEANPLLLGGRPWMPSAVFLHEEGGLRAGWEAIDRGAVNPSRLDETPLRHVAAGSRLLLGDESVPAIDAAEAVLRAVLDDTRRSMGEPPQSMTVAIPATWSGDVAATLRTAAARAARAAGAEVTLRSVRSPLAAVTALAAPLVAGEVVAVVDLGAGAVSCAVVHGPSPEEPWGAARLVWPTGGEEDAGGDAFDEHLYGLVVEELARADPRGSQDLLHGDDLGAQRARLVLRRHVRDAREQLSTTPTVQLPVPTPALRMTLQRDRFEPLIADEVQRCVDALLHTIEGVGHRVDDVDRVLVIGGACNTPMVQAVLRNHFGDRLDVRPDAGGAVALGAATLAPRLPAVGVPSIELRSPRAAAEAAAAVLDHEPDPPPPSNLRLVGIAAIVVLGVLASVAAVAGLYRVVDATLLGDDTANVAGLDADAPDADVPDTEPGGITGYGPELRANFMAGCDPDGTGSSYCECVYDGAAESISFKRFGELERRLDAGGGLAGTELELVVERCRGEVDVDGPPAP